MRREGQWLERCICKRIHFFINIFVYPWKFCISIVFIFSWDLLWLQEKIKTMLMQNTNKEYYESGLWLPANFSFFLVQISLQSRIFALGARANEAFCAYLHKDKIRINWPPFRNKFYITTGLKSYNNLVKDLSLAVPNLTSLQWVILFITSGWCP